ncbi:sugar phosphate isomerase/epimerase family protein [Tautonia sociabilis]|uniref:Sugar phosphate isomerase/epimerase n=1 Tax=Tautonia sociabilis TaxID=2080755 RepID=A0A432MS59_9BACT|nr:TIM barrel protein [Tautonia sociabilis]RUL89738.1 sugar phosphate isomerase/epimerase [Tautonia sociabilis]
MLRCLSPRMLGLRLDARETIEQAAHSGFDGVELLVRDLAERGEDPSELAARMADLGLSPISWPLPVDWRGDQERFRSDLAALPRYARIASRLGLDRSGTWVLPAILDPGRLHGPDPAGAALCWHVERLDPIAAILADHGQRLGLEAIGVPSLRTGGGLPFIDRLGALGPLREALRERGRAVGLIVDAFHLFAAGEPVEEALAAGVREIVSVHVSEVPEKLDPAREALRDDRRTLPRPGGVVPCSRLLQLLAEEGYAGPVFAEPVAGGAGTRSEATDPGAIIQEAGEALRSIWPAGGSAGRRSGQSARE